MKVYQSKFHLSYCTNIHPAESWLATFNALETHALKVRDQVEATGKVPDKDAGFALGLRLSAEAADELLEGDNLDCFIDWLKETNTYVYTINGFPYGAFHGTRVKEKVYQPDWTTPERLSYTLQLFNIIAELAPQECGGSVSTLPGSFKEFGAKEKIIFENLYACAKHIDLLAHEYEKDLHLGLEPEPLGHFENLQETLDFFHRFNDWALSHNHDVTLIHRRIGLNYDTCHFALEYEDAASSLKKLHDAKIRISKIHLSNAIAINASDAEALQAIKSFDEPTYLHQVITRDDSGQITRHRDLPEFFEELDSGKLVLGEECEARVHFHIPLYADPAKPLGSTRDYAEATLAYLKDHPLTCSHLEMETYTWGVLPQDMQKPIEDQLTEEYLWTLDQLA
ncbi:hypothetical protein SAMN02745181_2471 [Rubritalea squalenifaciens DSM 18772]|uniref:Xylose isomerase-like TIM barrel n=1 Tax=Rubritalea squalenifaciens DSM 18772 TaxID=1123071 RepID=A0A1M6LQB5_9BACT|nr:metabolite traffic protein EboE [Rubritalea squalenifaciens]SHJ73399.1 hypothetical protein SAMN02745181_2471 [Rubritalea squalenifaciens DSM 18772]